MRKLCASLVLVCVSVLPVSAGEKEKVAMSGSPFGVAWGFLYGYGGAKPEVFLPELRSLGAGWSKVYLFWNQIEPEKGTFDWTAVDAYVDQLKSPEEGLIALFSASQWGSRTPVPLLPPSPPKNLDEYYRFVNETVKHCKGRVRYWQNDCEPNNPVYWAGNADEFVAELQVFYRAVKDADPNAVVICGGYDGVFNPPGEPPIPGQEAGLAFFDKVLKDGKDSFDVFDIRLYVNPYSIPACVGFMRKKMNDQGYDKPIVCTEYNGPGFFGFAENRRYFQLVAQWSQSIASTQSGAPTQGDAAENGVAGLYAKVESLAPQTRMFLEDAPADLEQKFQRLQGRDLVVRNVLALSAGVRRTLYWDLTHDTSARDNVMTLMFGKLKLEEFADGVATKRYLVADAFKRMTTMLDGVESVRRIDVPTRPTIFLFEVTKKGSSPMYVVWEQRDAFTGEDAPAVSVDWAWPGEPRRQWTRSARRSRRRSRRDASACPSARRRSTSRHGSDNCRRATEPAAAAAGQRSYGTGRRSGRPSRRAVARRALATAHPLTPSTRALDALTD